MMDNLQRFRRSGGGSLKNLLFIAYYFPPMGMGGVQRSVKFVKYLPEFGYEPTVLTVRDVHYYQHDPSLSADIANARIIRTESLDPLRILRTLKPHGRQTGPSAAAAPSAIEKCNRVLSRWVFIPDSKIAWIPFAVSAALRSARRIRFDAIFTTSPPHSAHLAGLLLQKALRVPWIADFRDSWLMEKFDRVPTRFHRMINDRLLRAVVGHADRLVAVSEPILSDLKGASDRSRDAFLCIPNGFDPEDFRETAWTPSPKFRITYCGTANPVHSPDDFFRGLQVAFGKRPDLRPQIEVRFVGSVTGIDLDRMADAYGIRETIRQTGYLAHSESLRRLMDSDLLLLVLPSDSSAGVVTGKLYEYMASGIPILGIIPDGEAKRLIRSYARGITVHPDDPQGISGTLIRIFDLWKRGGWTGRPQGRGDVALFDRRLQARNLAGIFDCISRSTRS
jgi:glycosyltransferase involved in cell wall biosynthesis